MSDEPWIKLVRSYLAGASDASRRYDTEAARYYLAQAADAAAEIDDDKKRRLALFIVAKGAVNVRDTELSQQLARKLIRLDRKLANPHWVIVDLLSYGSSLHQSLQHLEAEDVYRQAFDLALEIKSWQNAAAAGSNYAMAIAARGDLKRPGNGRSAPSSSSNESPTRTPSFAPGPSCFALVTPRANRLPSASQRRARWWTSSPAA